MPWLRMVLGAVILVIILTVVAGLISLRGTALDVVSLSPDQEDNRMMAVELGTSSELGPAAPIDDTI
jgi:hypothetical protein